LTFTTRRYTQVTSVSPFTTRLNIQSPQSHPSPHDSTLSHLSLTLHHTTQHSVTSVSPFTSRLNIQSPQSHPSPHDSTFSHLSPQPSPHDLNIEITSVSPFTTRLNTQSPQSHPSPHDSTFKSPILHLLILVPPLRLSLAQNRTQLNPTPPQPKPTHQNPNQPTKTQPNPPKPKPTYQNPTQPNPTSCVIGLHGKAAINTNGKGLMAAWWGAWCSVIYFGQLSLNQL
ncbi:hypothetical protein Pmani_028072, partial [Petrolisthes manimaculis]